MRLRELWEFRELLYFLIWRDLKVRYKQTLLGVAWAVLQPLSAMAVFSLFLGRLARLPSDGVPYPVFCFAALVPWVFFANGLTQAAAATVQYANLIKKVYFPRLAIPIARVLAGALDFSLSFVLLLGMVFAYRIVPGAALFWLPLFMLLALATSLGAGLWLSALNVRYRDVGYTVPFLVQLWFFATPVAYSSRMLPGPWRAVYGMNPMAGVVEGFRWALLGTPDAPGPMVAVSALVAAALLVSGAFYFRRAERHFADVA